MLDFIFIVLLQTAAGEPVPAAEVPLEQPAAIAAPAADGSNGVADRNTRRCRAQSTTGSRLRSRVCLSPAEEDALAREADDLLRDASRMWDNQSGTIDGGGR